jgi:hypothetical protein
MPSLGRVAVDAAPFTSTQLCEVCLAAAVRARRGPCVSSNHKVSEAARKLSHTPCPARAGQPGMLQRRGGAVYSM